MLKTIFRILSITFLLILFKFGDSNFKIKSTFIQDNLLYQSWGFFTNNPLYSNLYHYKVKNNKIIYIETNTSNFKSLFGIRRDIKRRNEAFNFVYKTNVFWIEEKQNSIEILLNSIKNRNEIDFSKSRSKLEKGIYITQKIETIELSKSLSNNPRKAMYIFEVK